MVDTDSFESRRPSSGPDSVKPEQTEQRMRKVAVGLLAVIAPSELDLALIEYPTGAVAQVLTFGIVPFFVFGYIMNAQQLSGTFHDSDWIFRTLIHPVTQTIYVILGLAGVGGAILAV